MPDKMAPIVNGLDEPTTTSTSDDDNNLASKRQPMAKLMIEEPRLSDEALYKCDVTYVKGKCPSISLVRVQIVALPEKAHIYATSGEQAMLDDGQLVGPFNELEQLRLSCVVRGGRPAPKSVIWRKIDSTGRTINLIGQQNKVPTGKHPVDLVEVHLNHTLTSADLGAKFECHVEHEALATRVVGSNGGVAMGSLPNVDSLLDLHPAGSQPSELSVGESSGLESRKSSGKLSLDSHVYVDLNVGVASLDLFMAKVNKINASEPLREGDLVELECIAYNSRPPANISWFNGQDAIEQLDASTSVTLSPLRPTTGSGNSRQRHKRLLQRNQIHQNSDGHTFNTHSFLSIKLSRHEHKAQISCQAQNSPMRQPLTKSIELQVQHAPIVLMEPAAGLTVNEHSVGQDLSSSNNNVIATTTTTTLVTSNRQTLATSNANQVNIYCIYSANPIELQANSTRWFKDGQLLNVGANQEAEEQSASLANGATDYSKAQQSHLAESLTATGYPVLTINEVNRRDAGLYECQLANSIGQSERLPASETCRLEVNFRPSVQLRLFKSSINLTSGGQQHKMEDLVEVDLNQELILAGNSFVLVCEVLEAQPSKIHKFHWYKNNIRSNFRRQQQPMSSSENGQFVLSSLANDFAPSSYFCSATNALGASDPSNQIDLQLSYSPGPSHVVPVLDPNIRKALFSSGRPTHPQSTDRAVSSSSELLHHQQGPIAAGGELLLECVTPDLGQPRANIWLWFKNGQSIEATTLDQSGLSANFHHDGADHQRNNHAISQQEPTTIIGADTTNSMSIVTNPITDQDSLRLDNSDDIGAENINRRSDHDHHHNGQPRSQAKMKLISSGRYLFIPLIQLAHKGNYSCVAVNRLGSSSPQQQQQQQQSNGQRRESYYQLNVALAPSFVQPLATQTLWQEQMSMDDETKAMASVGQSRASASRQLELICHVQCEPICQIEWLHNGEPLDIKRHHHQLDNRASNYVTYTMEQSIMAENEANNMFKSVESKLVFHFSQIHRNNREKILERRKLLAGSNYTCQSSSNSMGPSVRSTTRFIVQYPPERVLINAPSDRLSLVEGSNGPRLSCEAQGEPRVQFRWLLVRSNGSVDSLLTGNSHLDQESAKDKQLMFASKGSEDLEHTGSDNDIDGRGFPTRPIDLTQASSEQVGVTPGSYISTLDMSGQSIDRKQSGQYVCEASNRLGSTRQSVYVNILYKPICATLHLHSLDVTVAPSLEQSDQDYQMGETAQPKPYKATTSDEYRLVRDTSEDFIGLRKMLILAPLLNRFTTHKGNRMPTSSDSGDLTLSDTIFQTILNERKNPLAATGADNEARHSGNLLMSVEDGQQTNNIQSSEASNIYSTTSVGDSWDRFNNLLLRFLNNYSRQVKTVDDQLLGSRATAKDKRQNRRSNQASNQFEETVQLLGGAKNLITFACMAQDGNPMNNLTFDWSFGSMNLPELGQAPEPSSAESNENLDGTERPKLIYTNGNNTLSIFLIRRLDTKTSLNPFQMSLLTLNVVVVGTSTSKNPLRVTRHTSESVRRSMVGNKYQSSSLSTPRAANNIQFEFETKPYNSGNSATSVELNEQNWQEKLSSLLACTVSNQIGTSDSCPAKINVLERAKNQASSSEFAKWRMPSLAHKSLLIISILAGCALAIFVTLALLLSPYLKELNIARSESSGHSSKADSNTGQSTSSQKSSVLGLLGNGDSSLQGSSDDDSSTRMGHMGTNGLGLDQGNGRLPEMDNSAMSRSTFQSSSHHHLRHPMRVNTAGPEYDRPRMPHERFTYHPDNLMNDINIGSYSGSVEQDCSFAQSGNHNPHTTSDMGKSHTLSTGSRLLSNLKQLSKFKVDRVADLANFGLRKDGRDLHMKTVSNSETNTTGLSVSALDSVASPAISSNSPSFFRQSNMRQSHLGFSRQPSVGYQQNHTSYYPYNQTKQTETTRLSQLNVQAKHLTSGRTNNHLSPLTSAYSNMFEQQQKPYDAMEEFMRQRGLDTSLDSTEQILSPATFRSQSIRQFQQPNDLNRFYQRPPPPPAPQTKPRPFLHSRVPQQQQQPQHLATTMYRTAMDEMRPPIAARSLHHRQMLDTELDASLQCQTMDNRLSMPPYGQTFVSNQIPMQPSGYLNTIDSHLNRMADSATMGRYHQQQQITYANATAAFAQGHYDDIMSPQNQSVEHIYDLNAYATPEQTPISRIKAPNTQLNNAQMLSSSSTNTASTNESERPKVSQLIQTFNTKPG